MAMIEGIRIRNFGILKDITIGRLWNLRELPPLKKMVVVIGKNGCGKSSLFDALGFLADCLRGGVEEACDRRERGGFERIRSQGEKGPIEFMLYYKETRKSRPITYELSIDAEPSGRPYVKKERLRQRRAGEQRGRPFSFLILNDSKGWVWKGEQAGIEVDEDSSEDPSITLPQGIEIGEKGDVTLDDKHRLGIATLGALKEHPRISAFRRFIEGWHLSYFTPDAARSLPLAGPQRHLNARGDNLSNVVQFMERKHPKKFQSILSAISSKIPGIEKIDTKATPDGRLLLRFKDQGFKEPFYAQQMSDGTLKVFAYLLLLEDPSPPPFLCIEEPENGLYHKLLGVLAKEFREHPAKRRNGTSKGGTQIFITTHQPYFVNALEPEEVWILKKKKDGFSEIRPASKNDLVNNLVQEELPLGSLWYSGYLDDETGDAS